MDMFTVIVMIVLFIFLMIFVFSTALLTPLIGKKNLISVIGVGFVVGLVGGAFLIAPIYNDIPDMARSYYTMTNGDGSEYINANISTENNITNYINEAKKIDGVKNIQNSSIYLTTSNFSSDWGSTVSSRLPDSNSNVASAQAEGNNLIILSVNSSDPSSVADNVTSWLMLVNGISVESSYVDLAIQVDPSKVNTILGKLPDEAVINNVTGPVETNVNNFKKSMPSVGEVILICGFIGVIVGLVGLFVDSFAVIMRKIRGR